jgi:hypothetical protein
MTTLLEPPTILAVGKPPATTFEEQTPDAPDESADEEAEEES